MQRWIRLQRLLMACEPCKSCEKELIRMLDGGPPSKGLRIAQAASPNASPIFRRTRRIQRVPVPQSKKSRGAGTSRPDRSRKPPPRVGIVPRGDRWYLGPAGFLARLCQPFTSRGPLSLAIPPPAGAWSSASRPR